MSEIIHAKLRGVIGAMAMTGFRVFALHVGLIREDPPSRLRHHLSNVRTFATDDPDHLSADSALLLFRSRGDVREGEFLSAGREDLLRREGEQWKPARRVIMVDESVIRMQNLAIFL